MRVSWSTQAPFFVRITGRNGKTRELRAALNPLFTYTLVPRVDAVHLGYQEAVVDALTAAVEMRPANMVTLVTPTGSVDAPTIGLVRLQAGSILIEGLEAIAFDFPEGVGFDVVLGQNFLQRFIYTADALHARISLEQ